MRRGEVREEELDGWDAFEEAQAEEEALLQARREAEYEQYLEAYGSYFSWNYNEGDR